MTIQTIYLLRHGQTDYNKKGIIQGRKIDAPLNEEGRRQAKITCEYFKNIPLDKIYTSTLIRTHQTVTKLDFPKEKLAGFDEISWGEQEGKQGNKQTKTQFQQLLKDWKNGKLEEKITGGENPIEVEERQRKAIQKVFAGDEKTVLICMHGRAMRILLSWFTVGDLSKMDDFSHQNCSFYKLIRRANTFEIELFDKVVY